MKTRNGKASTATRKYFHALVVIVYTSGVFIDVNFLYLSSIVGICFMGLLEHMRLKNIEPVSSVLKNAYKVSFPDFSEFFRIFQLLEFVRLVY